MSKKKHKKEHDSFEMTLEEKLSRIYDGYQPSADDTDEYDEQSAVQNLLNNVGSACVNEFSATSSDDEMPSVDEIPSEKNIEEDADDNTVDSLSVLTPRGIEVFNKAPSLPIPPAVLNELGDTSDDGEEDANEEYDNPLEDDFEIPEVSIDLHHQTGIVTFTDRYNCVTLNLKTLLLDNEHKRKIPEEKLSSVLLNTIEACITTTMPVKIMTAADYAELTSMTGNFDERKYRFCDMTLFGDSDKKIAVYKVHEGLLDDFAEIIAITERYNATAIFLSTLQKLCFTKGIVWDYINADHPDAVGFINESNPDFDFVWNVFFKTDGVDPVSSAGKHQDVKELKDAFTKAEITPGMFWDDILDFDDDSYGDTTDDDDEEDEETEDASDGTPAETITDEESADELAAALEDGLKEDIPTESIATDTTPHTVLKSSPAESEFEADELVFDVIKKKGT